MKTTIALRFPLGCFHATPWGHSVNEAATEWPPSPWRLARALYAAWKWRLPEIPAGDVLAALESICDAPSYSLPPYTEGHTRHYMPDRSFGTDMTFDAFVLVDPKREVLMRWESEVSSDTHTVLEQLCASVSYLGRAESIVDLRLFSEDEETLKSCNWIKPGVSPTLATASNSVLVPRSPLDERLLVASTTETRKAGRVTPLGARWVSYPPIEPSVPAITRSARRFEGFTASDKPTAVLVRFAPSSSPHVLPNYHEAALYGSILRDAAIKKHHNPSETLSGRPLPPENGTQGNADELRRLSSNTLGWNRDNHAHAHFIALDMDEDRMLDSALIWAPNGMDMKEVKAISSISYLQISNSLASIEREFRPVRVFTEAWGTAEDIVPQFCRLSKVWTSVTPFAPYRHQKKKPGLDKQEALLNFLKTEVDRELNTRGMPGVASLDILPGDWWSFRRKRKLNDPELRAFGLQLTFEDVVRGPLALGALSHFGLGLFKPVPIGR